MKMTRKSGTIAITEYARLVIRSGSPTNPPEAPVIAHSRTIRPATVSEAITIPFVLDSLNTLICYDHNPSGAGKMFL